MSFWVVGGHYEDTKFVKIRNGFKLEKYGPFKNYEEAKKKWEDFSWNHVDDCYIRYTIVSHK